METIIPESLLNVDLNKHTSISISLSSQPDYKSTIQLGFSSVKLKELWVNPNIYLLSNPSQFELFRLQG